MDPVYECVWDEYTQFKDTVHGYIKVHKPLAKKIINTPEFQRLKHIEQTGMGVLYPSATHNRFSHSLGVYHLGTIAFDNFKQNIRSKYVKECYYLGALDKKKSVSEKDKKKAAFRWRHWEILFKIACLLHDIGHAPFSHSLEILYDVDFKDAKRDLPGREKSRLNVLLIKKLQEKGSNKASIRDFGTSIKSLESKPHERMSAYLILNDFGEEIKRLICDYAKNYDPDVEVGDYIKDCDPDDDLEFMVRMVMGCEYDWRGKTEKTAVCYLDGRNEDFRKAHNGTWKRELQIRNCIIKLLNSKIDVDNLDYATRDTHSSGYANSAIDIERLLNSLTVIEAYDCRNADVHFTKDKPIRNPLVYDEFQGNIFNVTLLGKFNASVKKTEDNGSGMKIKGKYLQGGKTNENISYKLQEGITTLACRTEEGYDFLGTVEYESKNRTFSLIEYGKNKEGKDEPNSQHLYINGIMAGEFTGKIYGHADGITLGGRGVDQFFELAYNKSSQSVISGAITARNYEYLWIYAHHTVTYQTNYLTLHMLKKYSDILRERKLVEILDNSKSIFENGKCSGFTGADTEDEDDEISDEIFDGLFYDLYYRINSEVKTKVLKKGAKKNSSLIAVSRQMNEFEHKLIDHRKYEDIIDGLEKIKEALNKAAVIKKIKEYVLFDLIFLYDQYLDKNKSGQFVDIKKRQHLKEVMDMIYNFHKEYYPDQGVVPKQKQQDILVLLFKNLIRLGTGIIENTITPDEERCLKLLKEQGQYLRSSLGYMCDIVAMLEKRKIASYVFYRSSDSDLDACYRFLKNELEDKNALSLTDDEREFMYVAEEYFSRKFADAMWKTYSEFNHLFRKWSESEKNLIFNLFKNFDNPGSAADKKDRVFDYYILSGKEELREKEALKPIRKLLLSEKYSIERFVFVSQTIRTKSIDSYNTFFAFKNEALRLKDTGLFNENKMEEEFFYFYYNRKYSVKNSLLTGDEVVKFLEDLHGIVKNIVADSPELIYME
jgi:HD superfamily phosphohydrolase